MSDLSLLYVVAVLLITFAIDFALRAVPFAIVEPLRKSFAVRVMAAWMPAGILVILALATFRSTLVAHAGTAWQALVAAAVTIVVHLFGGRRTLLSVGAGTLTYVLLVNLV